METKRDEEAEEYLKLATAELRKINDFKAPLDKTVIILNCCKIIAGLLSHKESTPTSTKHKHTCKQQQASALWWKGRRARQTTSCRCLCL